MTHLDKLRAELAIEKGKNAIWKVRCAGADALAASLQRTVDVLSAALSAQVDRPTPPPVYAPQPWDPNGTPGPPTTGSHPNMAQWNAQMNEEKEEEPPAGEPPLTTGGLSDRIAEIHGDAYVPVEGDFVDGTAWPQPEPVTEETPPDGPHPGESAQ